MIISHVCLPESVLREVSMSYFFFKGVSSRLIRFEVVKAVMITNINSIYVIDYLICVEIAIQLIHL